MKLFLTSNILSSSTGPINPDYGFSDYLCSSVKEKSDIIFLSANPDEYQTNDTFSDSIVSAFNKKGIYFSNKIVVDSRNPEASQIIGSSENQVLVLSNGDVFTQNKFIRSLGIKSKIKEFKGTIVAAGGGAMNCSSVLYVMPRTIEQLTSSEFLKFIPGLGLSQRAIIPHYERVQTRTIGSKHYFKDIILSDSMGKSFFALPEKSYIMIENGFETIKGPILHITDGVVKEI